MQLRELEGLSNTLEVLRRKYDQYFIGLEKVEPGLEREQFERALAKSKLLRSPLNTVRYRYGEFLARVRLYQGHWQRVLREIEEGTYRRGATTMAERQAAQRAEVALRRAQGLEPSDDSAPNTAGRDDGIEVRRVHTTAKSAEAFLAQFLGGNTSAELPALRELPRPQPPAARPPDAGVQRSPVATLFDAYVAAKKERGDDVSKMSLSAFSKSLEKQREQARTQLGADVELKLKVTPEKVSVIAVKKREG